MIKNFIQSLVIIRKIFLYYLLICYLLEVTMDRYVRCIKSVIILNPETKTYEEHFTESKRYKIAPLNHYAYRNGTQDPNLFDLVLYDNLDEYHCVAQAINKDWEDDFWFDEHFIIEKQ